MFKRKLGENSYLRLLTSQDAAELFALVDANRQHLRQWLCWLDFNVSVDDSLQFIKSGLERQLHNNGLEAGIFVEEKLAGVIGLHYVNHMHRHTEIGYWLGQAYVGRGLVTHACQSLIEYCFNDLNLNKINLACATGNTRSCAVSERLGFSYEGTLRQNEWLYDHFVDHKRYSLLASEWMKKNLR